MNTTNTAPPIDTPQIEAELRTFLSVHLGKPVSHMTVRTGGYSLAVRRQVHFMDGTSVFVKAIPVGFEYMAVWLAKESYFYRDLAGASFLAQCHGFFATPTPNILALLVLEDLSDCHWPPPWTDRHVASVLGALGQVRRSRVAFELPTAESQVAEIASWHLLAENTTEFLALGLCSKDWLDNALPTLIAAQNAAPLMGTDLLHLDIRSDNLCFRADGTCVILDWNWASTGNGDLDLACWLPSLHAEGGPLPETILPNAGNLAALLAGFFANNAGKPAPPLAPTVRTVQLSQLKSALPWAARALDLPPLDLKL
jgi:Phosphotransferase enzyme family